MLRRLKESLIVPLALAAYKGKPLRGIGRYFTVLREFVKYRGLVQQADTGEHLAFQDFSPWLVDRDSEAGHVDAYLYQDTWCAGKLAIARPREHVDVGSTLMIMATVAQFVPVTVVDIRPVKINMTGLSFRRGTLLDLPFPSASLESISSLNVVEHVGLGRYGDPLDPYGTDRACQELSRVLKPGGSLYVATPTERDAKTYFNAHRTFNPDEFIHKFSSLSVVEECYATGSGLVNRDQYNEVGMPFAYGCFHLTRNQDG